jgi:tRNA threonylcarbamoyl adenosine modification protein (Sua5/YciO/YrdC/YwlC family)
MSEVRYIHIGNPDHRDLRLAAQLLNEGKLVALPSDTNWIVVCHALNSRAVEALYRWKNEKLDHHFSLLCRDISQASEIATIEDQHFRYMKSRVPGHFTFILRASKMIRKILKASHVDHQVGVRIPPCPIFHALTAFIDFPLLSTNIAPAMLQLDGAQEIYSVLIQEEWPHDIALILDPGEYEFTGPSTVVDCSGEGISIVRQGAGEVD